MFEDIAAAIDALAVQLDCARVGLVEQAQTRGVVSQSPSPSCADCRALPGAGHT